MISDYVIRYLGMCYHTEAYTEFRCDNISNCQIGILSVSEEKVQHFALKIPLNTIKIENLTKHYSSISYLYRHAMTDLQSLTGIFSEGPV